MMHNLPIKMGKADADHVFLLRALVNHCINTKEKLFIVCVDFEGSFDKISRHRLFKKLQLFGAGTTFIFCIIAIYSFTDCIIYQKETNFTYHLLAGSKQGLPLSPWLFLFYINNIFDLFGGVYGVKDFLNSIHLLIHADNTTIVATSRKLMRSKIKTLISYCNTNKISLEFSKCEFMVVNGEAVNKAEIVLEYGKIKNVEFISLLGSQIGCLGILNHDLNLHMRKRFCAVNKFYNFLRSNKLAPIPVKLKVLEACVCSALLHNCETFGSKIPDDLEKVYLSLIKSCLGVRQNTPNKLVMMESNMPPIKSLIYSRQLNLVEGSTRKTIYEELIKHNNSYSSHYTSLCSKYPTKMILLDTIKQSYLIT